MRPYMKLGWVSYFESLAPRVREPSVLSMMSEGTYRMATHWLHYLRSNPYTHSLKQRGAL